MLRICTVTVCTVRTVVVAVAVWLSCYRSWTIGIEYGVCTDVLLLLSYTEHGDEDGEGSR